MPVTATQKRVLEFICTFQERSGIMPTRSEICVEFGWRSDNAAHDVLGALQRKGYITRLPGTARGLQLTAAARELLARPSPLPKVYDGMIALPVVDMAKVNRRAC